MSFSLYQHHSLSFHVHSLSSFSLSLIVILDHSNPLSPNLTLTHSLYSHFYSHSQYIQISLSTVLTYSLLTLFVSLSISIVLTYSLLTLSLSIVLTYSLLTLSLNRTNVLAFLSYSLNRTNKLSSHSLSLNRTNKLSLFFLCPHSLSLSLFYQYHSLSSFSLYLIRSLSFSITVTFFLPVLLLLTHSSHFYSHSQYIYICKNLPDMSQLPTSPFPKRWTSGPGNVFSSLC